MWDVVIIGAGPAGCSAALAARRARPKASVLLLDRATFPRDKACGDGIAPHAIDVLRDLGVPWHFPRYRPVRSLQLSSGPEHVARDMRRDAWVVPRVDFDDYLLRQAQEAGVSVVRQRVRSVRRLATSIVVDDCVQAAVVIAADGAHSEVRRVSGDNLGTSGPTALALRGYAPTPRQRRGKQVIAFSSIRQPAYGWSFDRGDGWSNVGYGEVMPKATTRPPLRKAMMIDHLERLLPGATTSAQSWRAAPLPLSGPGFAHPRGRLLYVGDAAHLVNPLTGEGIYYAVLTGALAGQVAVSAALDPGGAYRANVRRQLLAHFRTTTTVSRLARSPSLLRFGLRAAAARQSVFDDVVEIGLGSGVVTASLLKATARHGWR
ncbi:MAG: geranylgeranyl reductase family protein [Ornithinimicrobium sp.]